ncbi:MAG: protein tyrosine phosphatase [Pedosphaera sp.]|nr:protein tyrosine phosphatase [Pedosphaera sp.]
MNNMLKMFWKSSIRLKRCGIALVAAAVLIVTGGAGFLLYVNSHNNFHIVSAGQLYRSGQMKSDVLAQVIQDHGIKSILNLRGDSGTMDWYFSETNTAWRLGVQHFDFSLSANRELKDEEMDQILTTMSTAPKPILIHCKTGSDRTGLVGALYLYGVEGKSPEKAEHELNFIYGHVPHLFWRDTIAMDRSFWRYVSNHVQESNLGTLNAKHSLTKQSTQTYLVRNPGE